jgi:2-alkenal reductase
VTIISTGLGGGLGGSGNGGSGLGSGFVLSGEGEIATNAHVITSGEGKAVRKARAVFVRFADGNQVPAKIIGFDPFSDVGLIKVDPTNLTLRPLPLGHATALDVGEPVAAIGSPFGEEQSLSVGVVSALHRSISSLTGFQTGGAIQTDAAINRGNSGGPLLNSKGEVLGINSQIRTESGDGSGVGFAVSVDTVRRSLAQLRKTGTARYAYLGVSSARIYPQLAQRFGLPPSGAWVQTVVDGGPAGKAGLKAGAKQVRFQEQSWKVGGDVVTRVGDRKVVNEDDLADALTAYRPGDKAGLEVIRDGQRKTISVTLGERPVAAPDRG